MRTLSFESERIEDFDLFATCLGEIGSYNNFEAESVAEALGPLFSEFEAAIVARAGSPQLYVDLRERRTTSQTNAPGDATESAANEVGRAAGRGEIEFERLRLRELARRTLGAFVDCGADEVSVGRHLGLGGMRTVGLADELPDGVGRIGAWWD